MEWKSVEKDGLPKKEFEEDYAEYLVVVKEYDTLHKRWDYNVDMATFNHNYGYIDDHWMTYIDWREGQEVHITHWCKIEFPDGINRREDAH